jgi:hypothetical protein
MDHLEMDLAQSCESSSSCFISLFLVAQGLMEQKMVVVLQHSTEAVEGLPHYSSLSFVVVWCSVFPYRFVA